jgi:hypothetical protein
MRKKNLKWVIIVLFILAIVIFFLSRIKENPFNQVELERNNVITNKTEIAYYDTILHIGLNELDIDSCFLIIKDFNGGSLNGELDLKAYILGNEYQYIVYMKKTSRKQSIKFLSHELIHLKQFHEGRLKSIDNSHMEWEGKIMNGMKIPYKKRPWEKEAFTKQHDLEKNIHKILYE